MNTVLSGVSFQQEEACPSPTNSVFHASSSTTSWAWPMIITATLIPQMEGGLIRDPIAEKGEIALYGMVDNNPNNWIDKLGLNLYTIEGTWPHGRQSSYKKVVFIFGLPQILLRGTKLGRDWTWYLKHI